MSNHWEPCKVPETPQRGKVEERNPGQLVFNRGANCRILLLENFCIEIYSKMELLVKPLCSPKRI